MPRGCQRELDLTVTGGRPLAMETDERTSSIEPAGVMAMGMYA